MPLPASRVLRAIALYLLGFLPLSLGGSVLEGLARDPRRHGAAAAAADLVGGWVVFPALGLLLAGPLVLLLLHLAARAVARRQGRGPARLAAAVLAPALVVALASPFGLAVAAWFWAFPVSSVVAAVALGAAFPDVVLGAG